MKKEVREASQLVVAAYEAQDFLSGIGNFTVNLREQQVAIPAMSLDDLVGLPALTAQFTQNLNQQQQVSEADIQNAEAELAQVDAADAQAGHAVAEKRSLADRLALKMSAEQNPAYIVAYHNLMGLDYTVDVAKVWDQAQLARGAIQTYAKSGAVKAQQAYGLVRRLTEALLQTMQSPYTGPLSVPAMIAAITGKPAKKPETEEERKRTVQGDGIRAVLARIPSSEDVDSCMDEILTAAAQSPHFDDIREVLPEIVGVYARTQTYRRGFGVRELFTGVPYGPTRGQLARKVCGFIESFDPTRSAEEQVEAAERSIARLTDYKAYQCFMNY
ncbi:hypothetical protein HY490_04015 [Candidatus Woesearchaeota archaeon]|nr:hypothetical protein [Candidatus Woesearchaeota archaeon]